MTGSGREAVGLRVQLAAAEHRQAFLLGPVRRLMPRAAAGVSFADVGGHAVELLLDDVDASALQQWLVELQHSGMAAGLRALRDVPARSDGQFADRLERARYVQAQIATTRRALDLLAVHGAEVPMAMILDELRLVHAGAANPQRSAVWHVTWLVALHRGGPWPEHAGGDALRLARVAHTQWLRLTGGEPDHDREIAALTELITP